ncbi:MAG: RpiB/LacA/LacB family sugar-phosphate isomerase [Rickettsiaceae bacterium]|jgi:ribose 5-phosphate isomerase B|nr:RpiB/LacA/LacB family sugar-phosphate isomerase [Rickettsiaceae bacterium]
MSKLNIAIASDHAGFDLKSSIIKTLQNQYNIVDCGCDSAEISVDYPDFAKKVAEKITSKEVDFGILICGSGIGISIAANRFKTVRAALCHNEETAKLARQHNDANVLCIGARIVEEPSIIKMVETFLTTKFEAGRHTKRVEKLSDE